MKGKIAKDGVLLIHRVRGYIAQECRYKTRRIHSNYTGRDEIVQDFCSDKCPSFREENREYHDGNISLELCEDLDLNFTELIDEREPPVPFEEQL